MAVTLGKEESQAVDRIVHLIREEEDRKIVFLTGAGISIPVIPSVAELVDLFLNELGRSKAEVYSRIRSYSTADQYQVVAQELKQRRGERGLATAVQKAVIRALKSEFQDSASDINSIRPSHWNLPKAQQLLGQVTARIPRQQRSAIITTNFDPLIEVSLELNGVNATTLATPGNHPFVIDNIYGSLPVIHLHGFWASTATLSTALHLKTERPSIERMLARLLDKSVVIVVGYGGWEDSFTRALVRTINDGRMASLQSELIWLQHDGPESVKSHAILQEIESEAGVNIYCDIDAENVFTGVMEELDSLSRVHRAIYPGWGVPPLELAAPNASELLSYFNGSYPEWEVAEAMPRLRNASKGFEQVGLLLRASGDAACILSSPAGEGKSTVLQQCALDLAKTDPNAQILVRRPGAPEIRQSWLRHLRKVNELTVLFVDDADLMFDEIYDALTEDHEIEDNESGRILWVFAAHSSYSHSHSTARLRKILDLNILDFDGVVESDIESLVEIWSQSDALPSALSGLESEKIVDRVKDKEGLLLGASSLFGSVLSLWDGTALTERVENLLVKLSKLSFGKRNFRELLNFVAITQYAWHSADNSREGLSVSLFGRFANVEYADVVSHLIRPLGREIGISQIGDKVFVRHNSIAKVIFEIARDRGELDGIVREISRLGAELRYDPESSIHESNAAFRLARRLTGNAAVSAALGAIEGASDYLEPRVTYLTVLRENGRVDAFERYVRGLEDHLKGYRDYSKKARGFFVEWSVFEAKQGRLDSALRYALWSISDGLDAQMNGQQIEYALTNVKKYSGRLSGAGRSDALELFNATEKLLELIPSNGSYRQFERSIGLDIIGSFQNAVHVSQKCRDNKFTLLTRNLMQGTSGA